MDIFNNKTILDITGKIENIDKKDEALCNEVYFINAQNGKYIVKIANDIIRQDELDKEYNLINFLQDKINVPKILLYKKEKQYSYIIMEFLEGHKPTIFTDNILKVMAKTLKNIHNIKIENEFVDFDKLLQIAKQNMDNNRLDLTEFEKDDKFYEPQEILDCLKNNKPKAKACILHGDYRPKNMIINKDDLYVLDWGLCFVGDPYYDLAIIKWYFTDAEFDKFIKYYGIKNLDKKRLEYNEWLSAFLNI